MPKGFFTDTTICIGCKACEVACKQWNQLPDDGFALTGMSYDNTAMLGASTWRHVAFIERPVALSNQMADGFSWLFSSDVCKHCARAGCLESCPTGAIVRTEFESVFVQPDICNGCGYCVVNCPFGVIDRREDDGRAWKCTLCYDRLKEDMTPACAKACPTESIHYGELDDLREQARARVQTLHRNGLPEAYLYGEDAQSQPGTEGLNAFFLLVDQPEAYNLPPNPTVPTKGVGKSWRSMAFAALGVAAVAVGSVLASREEAIVGDPSYYNQPLLKEPVWEIDIPIYYFLGGAAGAALALGAAAQLAGDEGLQKFGQRCHWIGIIGSTVGGGLLIHDLGRPSRFLNMLRVFRPTSPMSVGAWILSGAAPLAITAGLFSNRKGLPGKVGSVAGYGAGLFGLGLAGYTGVLVGNTAIPVYQATRNWMPVLFLASSTASAASILDLLLEDRRSSRITFVYGTAGRLAELAAGFAVESAANIIPRVGRPLQEGFSGALWKSAAILTAVSLVVAIIPGESRSRRRWAGALGALGSLALRFAVHYAGAASAKDPRASFHSQRRLPAR